MNRILTKNANRIKTLEERLKDTEEQAIEASRRVREQEECSLTKLFQTGRQTISSRSISDSSK